MQQQQQALTLNLAVSIRSSSSAAAGLRWPTWCTKHFREAVQQIQAHSHQFIYVGTRVTSSCAWAAQQHPRRVPLGCCNYVVAASGPGTAAVLVTLFGALFRAYKITYI